MPRQYLPKIKTATVKDMAKGLLATSSGKKISATKFKQFLKKDQQLKQYYYTPNEHRLSKLQAKNFIGKVASSAANRKDLKISQVAAKKMGLRVAAGNKLSQIGLNKIFQRAVNNEVEANKPTGPTPAELEQKRRHDRAAKALRQRDRADEIRKDPLGPREPEAKEERRAAPPTSAGGSGTAVMHSQYQASAKTAGDDSAPRQTAKKTPLLPLLVVFPLCNYAINEQEVSWLIKKIAKSISQTMISLRLFKIIQSDETPADKNQAQHLARENKADLFTHGYLKKSGLTLEIKVEIVNVRTNQSLEIGSWRGKSDDLYDLERKINWQISNSLQGKTDSADSNLPSGDEAIDLPI